MVTVDEELDRSLHGFRKIRNIFPERFLTKRVGLRDRVDSDGVLVASVVVLEVGGELAFVFPRLVDEIGDGSEDRFTELFGHGGFAVTKVGEEGESGHADLLLITPRAVFVLSLLEETKSVYHSVFTLLSSAVGIQS